jgi:hypothetical protein
MGFGKDGAVLLLRQETVYGAKLYFDAAFFRIQQDGLFVPAAVFVVGMTHAVHHYRVSSLQQ